MSPTREARCQCIPIYQGLRKNKGKILSYNQSRETFKSIKSRLRGFLYEISFITPSYPYIIYGDINLCN